MSGGESNGTVNKKRIVEMMTSIEQHDRRGLEFLIESYRTVEGARALVPVQELTRLLRFAVTQDSPNCVPVLIAKGADVGVRDFMNRSLLWQAAVRSVTLVETLLRSSATSAALDVNEVSSGAYGTALMAAALAGHVDVAQALIRAGADVNLAAIDTKETPLIGVAKRHGRTSIARLLLDAGANVNAADSTADTALHWATNRGHAQCVRLLLLCGADTLLLNARQESALAIAQRFRHHEIVLWLTTHPRKQMRDLLVFLCLALQSLELPVLLTLTIYEEASRHLEEFAPRLHTQWEIAKRIKHYHQ